MSRKIKYLMIPRPGCPMMNIREGEAEIEGEGIPAMIRVEFDSLVLVYRRMIDLSGKPFVADGVPGFHFDGIEKPGTDLSGLKLFKGGFAE